MKLRASLWKLHRWTGIACLLPMALVMTSGCALLLLPSWNTAYTAREAPAGIDAALQAVRVSEPAARIGMVLPPARQGAPWTLTLTTADHRAISVPFNGLTGAIGRTESTFSMRKVLISIHNTLLLGTPGKVVVLLGALGLILLAVSGFAMMRARLRVLRRAPWRGASPAAALHKWAGLAGMAMLLLWAASGFVLLGFKMLGGRRPGPPTAITAPAPPAGIARASRAALIMRPGTEIMAIMPGDGSAPITVMLLDRAAPPWGKSLSVNFDAHRGNPLPDRPAPGFMKVMVAAKSLHTALWSSGAVRALYLLLSLLPATVAVTGARLWLVRRCPVKRFAR